MRRAEAADVKEFWREQNIVYDEAAFHAQKAAQVTNLKALYPRQLSEPETSDND